MGQFKKAGTSVLDDCHSSEQAYARWRIKKNFHNKSENEQTCLGKRAKWCMRACFVSCLLFLAGCYSFTGGTIPAHIKTLQVASVVDQSGFGSPEYKIELETAITNNFMRDNSFELAETVGDAKLSVSIVSITEATNSVSAAELETEKRITVTCTVEYYDNVNKKQFGKKNFSSYGLFDINQALTARNETLLVVFNQIAEDIMLAVVSGG